MPIKITNCVSINNGKGGFNISAGAPVTIENCFAINGPWTEEKKAEYTAWYQRLGPEGQQTFSPDPWNY